MDDMTGAINFLRRVVEKNNGMDDLSFRVELAIMKIENAYIKIERKLIKQSTKFKALEKELRREFVILRSQQDQLGAEVGDLDKKGGGDE